MSDPRLQKVKTDPAGPAVEQLFKENAEIIVITVNPGAGGEYDLAIYQKVADQGSVLTPYLGQVLKRLVKIHEPKPRSRPQTTVSS